MSGNATTIVVGIVGVGVSVIVAYVFYWIGEKSSGDQVRGLRTQNGELLSSVDSVRRLLAVYVERMEQRSSQLAPTSGTGAHGESLPTGFGGGRHGPTEADSAVLELVRASLSVLQNERGEVDPSLLLDEVGRAVGPDRLPLAENELRRLRATGDVEWQGDDSDLCKVPILRVRPATRGGQAK